MIRKLCTSKGRIADRGTVEESAPNARHRIRVKCGVRHTNGEMFKARASEAARFVSCPRRIQRLAVVSRTSVSHRFRLFGKPTICVE